MKETCSPNVAGAGVLLKGFEPWALFQRNLDQSREVHHPECVFNRNPPVPNLQFRFRNDGALYTEFCCTEAHQGYTDRVHGGLIAAIIDASMTQCLMGHGIVAYTTELTIKYRNPVFIEKPALLKTEILSRRTLCVVKSTVEQDGAVSVCATGKFFRVKS